jgi:hypothetical protein
METDGWGFGLVTGWSRGGRHAPLRGSGGALFGSFPTWSPRQACLPSPRQSRPCPTFPCETGVPEGRNGGRRARRGTVARRPASSDRFLTSADHGLRPGPSSVEYFGPEGLAGVMKEFERTREEEAESQRLKVRRIGC